MNSESICSRYTHVPRNESTIDIDYNENNDGAADDNTTSNLAENS